MNRSSCVCLPTAWKVTPFCTGCMAIELTGTSFPNADEVVWIVRTEAISEEAMRIDVISSGYWLDALEETEFYESNAYADDIEMPGLNN